MNDLISVVEDTARALDSAGLYETASSLDAALVAIAQVPGSQLAQAITIITAMATASNRMLNQLYSLKTQNQLVLQPTTVTWLDQTNKAIGNAVSRLNTLIQTGTLQAGTNQPGTV